MSSAFISNLICPPVRIDIPKNTSSIVNESGKKNFLTTLPLHRNVILPSHSKPRVITDRRHFEIENPPGVLSHPHPPTHPHPPELNL
ncbi:hypothetical protein CEXT_544201 [Caerostris extrusa]|uniref:Uncharacterized protein n=1 Tax=Caerostris extrusa TaxID=172846 RepID=A0AAV4WU90_CAEEX|nr:hypothetical protein CEXT_544201 [Caerostris extrusa]